MPPLQKCVACGGEFQELDAASLCPFCHDAALKAAPHIEQHQTPAKLDPLPSTAKSRLICSCGFVASGRTPAATGDGYIDHISFTHGQVPLTPDAVADLQKAIA
jgi:hypothetical protein